MMVDSEFQFDFQKYLENEFSELQERLNTLRHKSLEEVWELQGKIRMLRNIGAKFKEMTIIMHGGKNAS